MTRLSFAVLVLSTHVADAAIKRILHLSDVHLNLSTSLDPHESAQIPVQYFSDAPMRLLESALAYASQVIPAPALLLYTGDHVSHGRSRSSEYVRRVVQQHVQMMDKYFPPSPHTLRVTAIVGNADCNPGYAMDVGDHANATKAAMNPTLERISSAWSKSLSTDQLEAFTQRGYLTYELDHKLTIVTLNTVPYSVRMARIEGLDLRWYCWLIMSCPDQPKHVPATSSLEDPLGQFAWLNATLQQLRDTAKFAFIAGHIPPIIDSNRTQPMWQEHYIRTYQTIVSAYPDVIKAQFFGHVHSVEFRLPLDLPSRSAAQLESPLFVSGSISPLFGNNPSFLVWEFDDQSYDMVDYVVYSTSNLTVSEPLVWKPLFRASKAYKTPSLSTTSLKNLRTRMRTDRALFDAYYWNMKAQAHNLPVCETPACRARFQCTLTWWPTQTHVAACVVALQSHDQSHSVDLLLPPSHAVLGLVAVLSAYALVGTACVMLKRLRRTGRVAHVARNGLKVMAHVAPIGGKHELGM